MNFGAFTAAAPEITLLSLICVVLVADLFVKDEDRSLTFWLTMASLAVTLWAIITLTFFLIFTFFLTFAFFLIFTDFLIFIFFFPSLTFTFFCSRR